MNPRAAISSCRRSSRLANVMPSWITSAPSARVAATLAGFASSGIRHQGRKTNGRRGQRDRLRVVAGAHRDHARGARFAAGQSQDGVECAADLERAGDLEAFGLEPQVLREVGREVGRPAHVAVDAIRRLANLRRVLVEEGGQAAAESRVSEGSRWTRRLRLVRTVPARMTAIPITIVQVRLSWSRTTPRTRRSPGPAASPLRRAPPPASS